MIDEAIYKNPYCKTRDRSIGGMSFDEMLDLTAVFFL